jgi:hypothetical protein
MRCKICNSIIDNPTWNAELGDWEVCKVCLDIINDVFEDPVTPQEEYEEDPLDDDLPDFMLDKPVEHEYNILMDGAPERLVTENA